LVVVVVVAAFQRCLEENGATHMYVSLLVVVAGGDVGTIHDRGGRLSCSCLVSRNNQMHAGAGIVVLVDSARSALATENSPSESSHQSIITTVPRLVNMRKRLAWVEGKASTLAMSYLYVP
jgi:hypothetical protein